LDKGLHCAQRLFGGRGRGRLPGNAHSAIQRLDPVFYDVWMSEEEPSLDPVFEKLHEIAKEWGYKERSTEIVDEPYTVPPLEEDESDDKSDQ
jgi:hypothetical protein